MPRDPRVRLPEGCGWLFLSQLGVLVVAYCFFHMAAYCAWLTAHPLYDNAYYARWFYFHVSVLLVLLSADAIYVGFWFRRKQLGRGFPVIESEQPPQPATAEKGNETGTQRRS